MNLDPRKVVSSVATTIILVATIPCMVASIAMAQAFSRHHRNIKSGMRWE